MASITLLAVEEWPGFLSDPAALIFMIPIVAILVGGISGMAKRVMRHRERMAMIERGMNPDQPIDPGTSGE